MPILETVLNAVQQLCNKSGLLQLLALSPTPVVRLNNLLQPIAAVDRPPVCMPAVSCTLSHVPFLLDTCCINDPSGHFLQTQFWDTSPALGGPETWTIHGLWPDFCEGGFDQFCNSSRSHSPEEITQIISNASSSTRLASGEHVPATHPGLMEFMTKHWLSNDHRNANLWAHEWNKHGTCISTLEPTCYAKDRASLSGDVAEQDVLDYFTHAALLYSTLPTYDLLARHGVLPSYDQTYDLEHLQRAIRQSGHGGDAIFRCRNGGELSEIWYSFHARASLRNAIDLWNGNRQRDTWMPTMPLGDQRSSCPRTGIKYLPKDGSKPPPVPTRTGTATATATRTAAPSAKPFTGKGRLMVKVVSDESTRSWFELRREQQQRTFSEPADTHGDQLHVTEPLPSQYTGCLVRHGTWYFSRSLSSCAIFTAQDDTKSDISPWDDPDLNYHLFTLSSRYAPCSFIEAKSSSSSSSNDTAEPDTAGSMAFLCDKDLPVQSILSNDASIAHQHTEAARRMTLGAQHKSVFFAEKVPKKTEQVTLWTDNGWGSRGVRVEVYWEGV